MKPSFAKIYERDKKKVKSASCSWAKGLKQSPHSLLYCNFTRGPALQCKMGSLGPQPWSSDKRARCWSKPSFGNAPLQHYWTEWCKHKRPRWWEEGRWRGYQQAMCPPFHSPPPPRKKPMYVCVCVCDVPVWINARTCTLTRLLPAFCRLCSHDQVSRISSAARPGKPKSRPNTIKHSHRSFIPEGAKL